MFVIRHGTYIQKYPTLCNGAPRRSRFCVTKKEEEDRQVQSDAPGSSTFPEDRSNFSDLSVYKLWRDVYFFAREVIDDYVVVR